MNKITAQDFPEFDVVERVLAPMPKFWSRIFQIASVLLVIALTIMGIHDKLVELGINVPDWATKAAAIASSVAAFLSKLTVDKEKWASQKS